MSNVEQQLLQISARLYQKLDNLPSEVDERDAYLVGIDQLLDERGQLLESLQVQQIRLDASSKYKEMLVELDKGIQERLRLLMNVVKSDLKTVQVAKTKEEQYINPYSSVHVMDGRYYDQKK